MDDVTAAPNIQLNHLNHPRGAGCSTGHKSLPPSMLADGKRAKLKSQSTH